MPASAGGAATTGTTWESEPRGAAGDAVVGVEGSTGTVTAVGTDGVLVAGVVVAGVVVAGVVAGGVVVAGWVVGVVAAGVVVAGVVVTGVAAAGVVVTGGIVEDGVVVVGAVLAVVVAGPAVAVGTVEPGVAVVSPTSVGAAVLADTSLVSPPSEAEPGEAGGPATWSFLAGAGAGLGAAGRASAAAIAGALIAAVGVDSAETGCSVNPSTAADPSITASRLEVATADRVWRRLRLWHGM